MTDIINEEENTTPLPEEEQETVVVDNGQTYESTESAIIAKEEADRAKLWAQESERQANLASGSADTAAQARDDAVDAKEYAEAAVTDANVVAVGTDLRSTPSNIITVAGMKSNIDDVIDVKEDIEWIANNKQTVTDVVDNEANINAVVANEANINAVNANKTNIDNVAANETNINAVNANKTNIDINATNINAINTNATNITDIQNASGNAARAKNWAVKTDGLVDGEDYSAKHYAEIASQYENPLRIGQIIQSTIPLSDAGLHLLDGALINGSGSYADFVTYIAGLVSTYPDLFETEANWQTSVINFGSCEKYVYDSVNNTVRLPKYTSEHGYLVKSYSSGADWYRIYSDGWCEQGSYSSTSAGETKQINLLVSYKDTDYMIYITSASNNNTPGHTFHAIANTENKTVSSFYTSENEYYGISTVIGYWKTCGYINLTNYKNTIYEYIVLATSTKTDIQVDIDEIVTDLNGKADVDLSNINPIQTVKNTIVGWGIPDYTAGISVTANQDYTIPKSGELIISTRAGGQGDFVIEINGTQYVLASISWTYTSPNVYAYLTFEKDDVIKIIPNGTPQYATYTFYPFRGV